MSHIAVINAQIQDLALLKTASQSLGLELRENQTTYKHYQKSVKGECSHALVVPNKPGSYEIGVIQQKGTLEGYRLAWDPGMGEAVALKQRVGENAYKLVQAYQAEVTKAHLPFGFETTQTRLDNGDLVLEAVRY